MRVDARPRSTSCCTRRSTRRPSARRRSRPACRRRPAPPAGEIVFSADEARHGRRREQGGGPGPRRDLARGHRRHARRGRHPHPRGGMTSHAAVVARGMGKCCVVGAGRRSGLITRGLRVSAGAVTSKRGDVGHARRLDRPGDRTATCALVQPTLTGDFATLHGLGR